ncbi:MAG TPA: type VI secretion system tip protein TssI/VgrG [Myxococcaceae bacterium]|jgi:type VI secretion system secreted protein VgrG
MSLTAPLQANQPEFDFEIESQAGTLLVLKFQAREALSRLYEVRLEVAAAHDVDVDPAALIGKPAVLTVHSGVESRFFHGIVVRMSQGGSNPGNRYPKRFEVTVVPKLWVLRHASNCRIFQDQTVPEIVEKLLNEHKIDHRLDLNAVHRIRDYCVQYRETDLDFVSRLLEEEGIAYRFEHEQDKHTLVLVDANTSYPDVAGDATLVFNPGGSLTETEVVSSLSRTLELRAGSVALRDFNFLRPAQDLGANEDADKAPKELQIYDYPGGYWESGDGKTLAKVRLQEVRTGADVVEGDAEVRRLVAGAFFTLSEHPEESLNQRLLLLEVEHEGNQPWLADEAAGDGGGGPHGDRARAFTNRFLAVPAAVPFRPERVTPKPQIHGAQTATVVGASGEEIDTDEHGRVKVQFHWSRADKSHPLTSCWVRVSQAWAGAGWGALWLPRIGHEVVVEFLEGDPDRPLITGSVYNGANPPPVPLPGQKTKSLVRSNSSPGGSGSNELRFEDAAGSEEVYLHAQKDLAVAIENDKGQTVGRDEKLKVGRDRSLLIQGNQAHKVDGNDDWQVKGNQAITVSGNRNATITGNDSATISGDKSVAVGMAHSLSVGAAATEQVGAAKMLTVGGAYEIAVGGAMNEVVGAFKSEQVGGGKTLSVGGDEKENVGGTRSLHVKGDMSEEVTKNRTLKVAKDLQISVGGKLNEVVKNTYSVTAKELNLVAEDTITIKVGSATITLKKSGDVVVKGSKVELNASGDLVLKASKISEN